MDMNITLDDELSLQQLGPGHVQALFALTEANREYLRQWLPWLDTVSTVDDTAAFIAVVTDKFEQSGVPHFAVFYKGVMCGVAGFHDINMQHRIGTVGYWLGRRYQGKGIITRAVKELLRLGFVELGLNRVEIRCAEDNVKSRAIPERLGFKNEATLRQCEWLYTRYVNHVVYSMLASEYEP